MSQSVECLLGWVGLVVGVLDFGGKSRKDIERSIYSHFSPVLQTTMANRGKGYGPPLDNISEAVGNTPLVKISDRLCPAGRTIYAKCEFFNPLSSVKDRLALSIIETAEKNGTLKPGQTVIEATSGNTGIGKSSCYIIVRLQKIIMINHLIYIFLYCNQLWL